MYSVRIDGIIPETIEDGDPPGDADWDTDVPDCLVCPSVPHWLTKTRYTPMLGHHQLSITYRRLGAKGSYLTLVRVADRIL